MKKWKLILSLAGLIILTGRILPQIPTDGLVGFYPFSGNANDKSGNGNDGTIVGATLTSDYCNNTDSAFYFDGIDDYILIPNSASLNPTKEITICAWIMPEFFMGHGNSAIVSKGYITHDNPYYQYHLGITGSEYPNTPGRFSFCLSINSQYTVIVADSVWNPGEWYFLTASYDGQFMKIYINGELTLQVIQTGLIDTYSEPLCIGRTYRYPGSQYTPGKIDDIRIYDRALSLYEIRQLYNAACSNFGLSAFYPFNGNAHDETGNGNDGQVNGPVLTTDRCGIPNSAYLFDGSNDYIALDPSNIAPESKGTFAAWVYFNSVDAVQYLGCLGDIESQDYYLSFVRYDPAYQSFTIYRRTPGNADILVGSTDISVHQWYFVVMTSDGNDWSLYVNGQKEILSAQSGINTGDWGLDLPQADNWLLGGIRIQEPHDHAYLNGKLDDIRIYDYPLSQDEILELYITSCPMEITGEQLFCQGQKNILFSVPLIEDLDYNWNYSGTGASLSSNQNQITINFSDNATSGILTVSAKRSNQTIINATLDISVLALPADPGLISGPAEACLNDGPYSFLVPAIEYAQDYAWDFSGQDAELLKESNTLTVYFFNDATSGSITVNGINQCGQGKTSQPHPVILRNCDIPVVPINFPNSFSPNGDNLNDLFVIRGLREGTAVTIFDSNGKTLYYTDNYNNDWGGIDSDGNIIPTGTYWYIIKVPGLSNELKGFLYIKR